MPEIKAIILDVDGVIVGEKIGVNAPLPNRQVIEKLAEIRSKGIYVILCTGKPHYAIQKIIVDARLNNPQISDGGAVIRNPQKNVIIKKNIIPGNNAVEVVRLCLQNKFYTELYSIDDYFVEKGSLADITKIHTTILQHEPKMVTSLYKEIDQHEIVKIMPIAENNVEKLRFDKLFPPFKEKLMLSWATHPIASPHQFGVITAFGVSKKTAVKASLAILNLSPKHVLGVGDSVSDWNFLEICGFRGVMGNSESRLKELAKNTGENSFIGPTVDENGIISILDHFFQTV